MAGGVVECVEKGGRVVFVSPGGRVNLVEAGGVVEIVADGGKILNDNRTAIGTAEAADEVLQEKT